MSNHTILKRKYKKHINITKGEHNNIRRINYITISSKKTQSNTKFPQTTLILGKFPKIVYNSKWNETKKVLKLSQPSFISPKCSFQFQTQQYQFLFKSNPSFQKSCGYGNRIVFFGNSPKITHTSKLHETKTILNLT